jgi:TolB-like protein
MRVLLTTLLFSIITICSFSQTKPKHDVILKLNGDELNGKVTEITDTDVKFVYDGETLVYSIKKVDILKITYASGRIEVYNKVPLPSESSSPSTPATGGETRPVSSGGGGLESHHNKVAILPFAFIRDGASASDALSEKAQTETFAFLSRHAGIFTILDPRTTNALLIKAGVTKENVKGYTMDDLCNILGVEYVVEGTVTVNQGSQTNYSSGQYRSTGNNNNKNYDNNRRGSSSTFSTSTQNFESSLLLSVYNDKGQSVYSQERSSFFNTQDAYKLTLEYLLKRTPLYQK